MITANFIHRTFRIKCGNSTGTGFTIDVDKKQYLVTAKHVIEGFCNKAPIEIFSNNSWLKVDTSLVGHCTDNIDISVLAPNNPISPPNLPVNPSSDGLAFGQDLYFLGYPYGILSNIMFGDEGYPLPSVKKGILSSMMAKQFLIDGHNNPGFSGGPVVFGKQGALPQNIAAVVSGYRYQPEPIMLGEEETTLTYKYNTGIMITYKIEFALELIKANPIGAPV